MAARRRKIYPERVHTRKIDRMVAKNEMLKQGVNVHNKIKKGEFSGIWREYVTI